MCNILPQLAVTRCDRDFVIAFSWLFWELCLCSTSEKWIIGIGRKLFR